MSIKQVIKYNSKTKYFAGFIQALIDESGVDAGVEQNGNEITLCFNESDPKKLELFGSLSAKFLPHSIFLGDVETKEESCKGNISFESPSYEISLCPKCLQLLSDPASDRYLDDTIVCDHYSNKAEKIFADYTNFSPHYSEGDSVLVVDSQNVQKLFVVTEDELKALFSIEKPTLKVTIRDEALKELTKKNFINIKSPYSVRSTLVALNAKEAEVPYVFFTPQNDFKAVVVQKNVTVVQDAKGICGDLENLNEDKTLNRFLNIMQEAKFENAIGGSLSVKNGISFVVSNDVGVSKAITFKPFLLDEVMELMRKDPAKSKMLDNFAIKYPNVMENLVQNGAYGLFETLCCVLELEQKSFEAFSDKALEFRGNGGLKIDTYYKESGFDYVSFLGSIMSFKLAGSDEHYLAYSVFEALGDMAISTMMQLKVRFKIDNFILMGDIFSNSILYSRILSKFQLSNPYFPKGIALDD